MTELSKKQIADIWAFVKSYTLSEAAALWIDVCPPEGFITDTNNPNIRRRTWPIYMYLEVPFRKRQNQLIEAVGNGVDGKLDVENFAPANIYNDSKKKSEKTGAKPILTKPRSVELIY